MTSTTTPASGGVEKRRRSRSPRKPLPWYAHIPVWLYAAALFLPLYFVVVSSLKDNLEIFGSPFTLPLSSPDWSNFAQAWNNAVMGPAIVNSIVIVFASIVLTLVLALPAAYAVARLRGRAGKIIEGIFASGLLIPGFAALVPTVLLAIALHLFQTRTFLILLFPAGALPMGVIMLAQFMRAVPVELEESAVLDGANRLQVLWHVYLPGTIPGIATICILDFLSFWNEFLFSFVLLGSDPAVRTLQVALPTLSSQTRTHYGILMAGTLISIIPVYLVYIVLQRRLEDAMLEGAVKS